MKRCVIIGGAEIRDADRIREALREDDYCIYCDCGLRHREALGREPDLIVGDFDSHENPHLPVETLVLPREKDDTDTVFAVKEAIRRGFTDFLLLGVIGARLDHSLGNVAILFYLAERGLHGLILDDYSEMEAVGKDGAEIAPDFPYFSLLNVTGRAKGVFVKDAKYPLRNAEITPAYPYGISNEPLPGRTAQVRVEDGELLLVRVRKP